MFKSLLRKSNQKLLNVMKGSDRDDSLSGRSASKHLIHLSFSLLFHIPFTPLIYFS